MICMNIFIALSVVAQTFIAPRRVSITEQPFGVSFSSICGASCLGCFAGSEPSANAEIAEMNFHIMND